MRKKRKGEMEMQGRPKQGYIYVTHTHTHRMVANFRSNIPQAAYLDTTTLYV